MKIASSRWIKNRANWIRLSPAPCLAQIEASFLPVWPAVKISTPRKSSQLRTSLTTRSEATRSIECVNSTSHRSSRNVSTESRRWWHNWLFKKDSYRKWKNSTSPPITSFTDDGAEGNLFNLGKTLASKTLDEPRLRCTEFDENGNVTLVNGEFRKSELIAKYGLLNRDLRKIDSSVLPHILVRPSTILISLLHLRVLIKADRVLVFDAYGSADSYT
ncbi:hypothetical protein F66182_15551, partial [Fusarium sp. NRRL 66182]